MKKYPLRIQTSSGLVPNPQDIISIINESVIELEDFGGYDIHQFEDDHREELIYDENNGIMSDDGSQVEEILDNLSQVSSEEYI
jgi:hypothetical protein